MPKALLLENTHFDVARSSRDHDLEVETIRGALSEDELINALDGTDLVGVRFETSVTTRALDARPMLSAIGCFYIGTNQADLVCAGKRGIAVFNAPYSNIRSVVKLVICDTIRLMCRIPACTHHIKHGLQDESASGPHEVRGKAFGIIGYGSIDSQLSVLTEVFGMRVAFYDTEKKSALGSAHRCDTLNELLEQSDIMTLRADGRESNAGFFDEDQFTHTEQDATFINLSCGFIVDPGALKQHSGSGHLSGAMASAFPVESKESGDPPETSLTNKDNTILTPRTGGSTLEAQESIDHSVPQRLEDYWFKGSTSLLVNLLQINLSEYKGVCRITHLYNNLPGVLAHVNHVLGGGNISVSL